MSDIVEKTLTALPGLFLQTPGAGGPAAARAPFSSRLGGLIRGITALTSKHVSAGRAGGRDAPEAPRGEAGVRREPGAGPPRRSGSGCRSIPASVWTRHFAAGIENWEAGFQWP